MRIYSFKLYPEWKDIYKCEVCNKRHARANAFFNISDIPNTISKRVCYKCLTDAVTRLFIEEEEDDSNET